MPFDRGNDAPDDALMQRYARGDDAAARLLAARHAPRVLALAVRMLGDMAEAEDVTQDAMLRLWKTAPDWRPGGAKVSTWLYRVASNLCTDRLRRRRGVGLDTVPEPEADAPGADQRLIEADRAAALQAALGRLPERQRLAVVLRHIEGLANPEIAGVLETSTEAVESLLARGRRALAADLGAQRDELGLER